MVVALLRLVLSAPEESGSVVLDEKRNSEGDAPQRLFIMCECIVPSQFLAS